MYVAALSGTTVADVRRSAFAERARYLAQAWKADVPVGPEDILPGAGMSLESIEEIILSHLHLSAFIIGRHDLLTN